MMNVINYLGKQKIIHLDFKPENICLNDQNNWLWLYCVIIAK